MIVRIFIIFLLLPFASTANVWPDCIAIYSDPGNSEPKGKTSISPKSSNVTGTVIDLFTGKPIEFASVILKGTTQGISTDGEGRFSLQASASSRRAEINVSAIGYETKTIPLSRIKNTGQQIYLKPEAHVLKPVVVFVTICKTRRNIEIIEEIELKNVKYEQWLLKSTRCPAGRVTMITKEEKKKTIPQKISVKVYPNPIIAGNSIQAAIQLKQPDQFHIDLIDASGRVIWMKKLDINSTQYNLTIPTQSTLSAGLYFLRVTGKQSQSIYKGKLVIQ